MVAGNPRQLSYTDDLCQQRSWFNAHAMAAQLLIERGNGKALAANFTDYISVATAYTTNRLGALPT